MAEPRRVTYMTFESPQDAYRLHLPDQPVDIEIPEPFASVLDHLEVDAHSCSVCQNRGVGYGLEGDADERCVWHWLTIAHDGARTWMLCEECAMALEPIEAFTQEVPGG